MDVWVFSDESGTFDNKHYKTFVYAGLIFTDLQTMESVRRRYIAAERNKRKKKCYEGISELKAFVLKYDDKNDLYKILEDVPKFAVVINQSKLDAKRVYQSPKTKQHYLDFAYISSVKKAFEALVSRGTLLRNDKITFHFNVDEHSTANDGNYDLQEELLKELRDVTSSYSVPLFPKTDKVSLKFCKSDQHPLVRGADIVANRVYSIFRPDSTFEKDINGEFVSLTFLP
jgi:hypothetical protein